MTNSDKMLDEMKRSWEESQGIGAPLPKDDPVQQAIDQVRQEKQDAGHHWANPRRDGADDDAEVSWERVDTGNPEAPIFRSTKVRVPREPASPETIQKMLDTPDAPFLMNVKTGEPVTQEEADKFASEHPDIALKMALENDRIGGELEFVPDSDTEKGERRRELALQAALQISHSDISAGHLVERAIEIEAYLLDGIRMRKEDPASDRNTGP